MAAEARVLGDLNLDVGRPSPRRRPKLRSIRPPVARNERAIELETMPARGLGSLPAAFTVRMRAVDGSAFYLCTSAAARDALAESGAIALDVDEWDALTLAAEADRAWPADLVLALRARGVTGRMSIDGLLDGVTYEQASSEAPREFSVGRVLSRIGARVEDVAFDESGAVAP
jgi:hypothetical protein